MGKIEPAADPSMEDILASIRRIIADDDSGRRAPSPHLSVVEREPEPRPAPPLVARAEPAARVAEPATAASRVTDLAARAAEAVAAVRPSAVKPEPIPRAEPPVAAARAEPIPRAEPPPVARIDAELRLDAPKMAEAAAAPVAAPSMPAPPAAPPVAMRQQDQTFLRAAAAAASALDPVEPMVSPATEASVAQALTAPPVAAAKEPGLLSAVSGAAVQSAFDHLATSMFSRELRTLEDVVKDLMRPMLRDWLDDNLPPLVERLVREEIQRVSRGRR